MKLRRYTTVMATALLGVSLLAACGGGDENGSDGLVSVTVRSAFTPSGSLTGPFLYALDKGYYEDVGLDVTVTDGKGSLSVAKDVGQGNVDIGQVGSPVVAQSIDQGLPLISVAQEYGRGSYGLIVDADSGIASIADLEGKSVVVSAGSPETVFLPAALDKAGVDPGAVEILNVDASVKGSTYAGGQGDALGTSVPFFMPLVSGQRPSEELTFDSAGISFPDYSLVVQPQYLEKNRDTIRKFLEATFKAAKEAADDPEGVGEALQHNRAEVTEVAPQVDQFVAYQDYVCSDAQEGKPVGWHSPDAWTDGLAVFAQYGDLQNEPEELDAYFTNEFFEGDDSVGAQTCVGGKAE